MQTPFGDVPVFDAHAHFFSHRFFQGLLEPIKARFGKEDPYGAMGKELELELPEADPAKLAARWVAEMDAKGVNRMVLMASAVGDEESAAAAVKAFPERITGSFMLDPTKPDAAVRVRRALKELGLRGVALFPAMHHFSAADERVWPILEAAAERGAVVFVHFGLLKIAIRERLGLPSKFDMRYSNPLDLHKAAKDFPKVNFQVPHFGCGFFREALMLGDLCENVHLDTSSSNAWVKQMPFPLNLRDLFEKSLAVFGPSRLLFGTDSTVFPRGCRADVLREQCQVLADLKVFAADAAAILGGNLTRLLSS
jgi:predicted TIM-barrel fold metal-dependent hydrolase